MNAAASAAIRTHVAIRDALADARRAWSARATAGVAVAAIAALVPFLLAGAVATETLASGAYAALGATGLALCVGLAGVPSLAQGAFVGTGAFVAAHVLRDTALPAEVCALVGAAGAALLGTAAGVAVRSLDSVRVAVSTWLLSWLVALALGALPWLSGGSQGLVVPERRLFGFAPTPLAHYELGVVLTGLCALALVALRRGPFGNDLAAAQQHYGAAAALGVPVDRLRVGAFGASAFVGGLAGGFAVQLDLVADPTAYGPLLSFELLVAVLVGGAVVAFGPSVGIVVLGLIELVARGLGDIAGVSASRFQPMLAALLLLAVLATGGSALVPTIDTTLERLAPFRRRRTPAPPAPLRPRRARLRADRLRKQFGAVTGADDVSLELEPGSVTALVGANGSGKTTLLRVLAGAFEPDAGRVYLDGVEITTAVPAERVRAGVVRTLQSRAVFRDLTALQTVLVGTNRTRRYGGALRALTLTPLFRREERLAEARARAALELAALEHAADTPAAELTGAEQQRLMIAAAMATEPGVLLLDEPSAGAGRADAQQLETTLERIKGSGIAVLLVEHNTRLVRAVADELIELEQGRVQKRERL